MKRPWKKYVNKIPDSIFEQIDTLTTDDFYIGCQKIISKDEIEKGYYASIGLLFDSSGELVFQEETTPDPYSGNYAVKNTHGYEKKYKDEPMIKKTYEMEVPNFGDWDKGSHTLSWDRDVYRKDFIPPRDLTIKTVLLSQNEEKQEYYFEFSVNKVFSKETPIDEDELFFTLNLLQETVGNFGILTSEISRKEYIKTLYVSWELLPVGEADEVVKEFLEKEYKNKPRIRGKLEDRYEFLKSLKPKQIIRGTSGFVRYIGALLDDNLVLFENLTYGNAIYIMFDDWRDLSKLTRLELLGSDKKFVRVRHTKTWKTQVKRILKSIGYAQN